MIRNSISHNNITRNVLCGLIFTVCLFVLSCGKRNSTHNYDPTTSSGTKQWTKQLGTSSSDVGGGVTTDSSDNIYVTGYTYGGLDGNTSSGEIDIFLIKYNSSGTKQWTKQLGTYSWDRGKGVTTDSSGNIYVTGDTRGGLDGNTNSGRSDIFLVKYNSFGQKK